MIESLESRTLLSVTMHDGTLLVKGNNQPNLVNIWVTKNGAIGTILDGQKSYHRSVKAIEVRTYGGSDHILVSGKIHLPVKVKAGAGRDFISTGSGNDRIFGGPDNDIIYGRAGADVYTGGRGWDVFFIDKADKITDFGVI